MLIQHPLIHLPNLWTVIFYLLRGCPRFLFCSSRALFGKRMLQSNSFFNSSFQSTIYLWLKLWWQVCSSYCSLNFEEKTRWWIFNRLKRTWNWWWLYFPIWDSFWSRNILLSFRIDWFPGKNEALKSFIERFTPCNWKQLWRYALRFR